MNPSMRPKITHLFKTFVAKIALKFFVYKYKISLNKRTMYSISTNDVIFAQTLCKSLAINHNSKLKIKSIFIRDLRPRLLFWFRNQQLRKISQIFKQISGYSLMCGTHGQVGFAYYISPTFLICCIDCTNKRQYLYIKIFFPK